MEMKKKHHTLIRKHLDEILEYRAVLSHSLKRKVTLEQAMTDWLEKGYAEKSYRRT